MNAVWRHLLMFFWGMAVASAISGVPAPGEARPEDGIYDPSRRISPPVKSALIREAASVNKSAGLDILVAVIERPGEWEPQQLAEDLANRWGYHGGRALVLWIPDRGMENPWIAVSGMVRSELSSEGLNRIVERAKERARTNSEMDESIRKAVVSLSEDLRFAGGVAAKKAKEAPKAPKLRTIDAFWVLLMNLKEVIAAGLVALVAGFYLVKVLIRGWKKLRKTLIPRTFPEISWRKRFGAPHGGIVYTVSAQKRRQKEPESSSSSS